MSGNDSMARVACDSLVALSSATRDGSVLFAKNSDRPAQECQPLFQAARQSYPHGTRLRCTYIDIPQVSETPRLIGSRPFWTWGFEHGLNEYGVAIGNHTVFTKDPLSGQGLIGMDLVRLGLERGHSAGESLEVMTGLIALYGQGGSGYCDKDWPYHNSFLVADRHAAFILETSDRQWATRRIAAVGSLSNHLTIGSDWDGLSDRAIEHAIAHGWWSAACEERFDFAAAYRDTTVVPEVVSSGRHQRTCTFLEEGNGTIDVDSLKRALRDHYGQPVPRSDLTPDDPQYFSVCMHAEPVGTTTASMIAHIPADPDAPLVYWASLGVPCSGAFVPLYIDGDIPAALTRGGEQASDDSVWWQCRQLLNQVERSGPDAGALVRRVLGQFESDIARHMREGRLGRRSAAERTAFMRGVVDALERRLRALITETAG